MAKLLPYLAQDARLPEPGGSLVFQPFRFLHASDLKLDEPCQVLSDAPQVRSTSLQAPLVAAERVFESARLERVDFVVLAGNVIHPTRAGAREFSFLVKEFQRLERADIAVYWAGGDRDRAERWPEHWHWPDNVHFFSHRRAEEVSHFREDQPLCTLIGLSTDGRTEIRPADFRHNGSDAAIAVTCGSCDPQSLAQPGITYWALGGRAERHTPSKSPHHAHYSGTPQGRTPNDVGPRGCTLVHVTSPQQVRTQFIATDKVRWTVEEVPLGNAAGSDQIALLLLDRAQRLQTESTTRHVNAHWQLQSSAVTDHGQQQRIESDCRAQLQDACPQLLSNSFSWQVDQQVPQEWLDEESILGDFLRSIQQMREDDELIPLDDTLTEAQQIGGIRELLTIHSQHEQERLLAECARLGSRLLRREDGKPDRRGP